MKRKSVLDPLKGPEGSRRARSDRELWWVVSNDHNERIQKPESRTVATTDDANTEMRIELSVSSHLHATLKLTVYTSDFSYKGFGVY